MVKMMPQEIQVWYVLPALRREFAKCLVKEHGLTQKEAAAKLGVTEAAVSQYFKDKRAGMELSEKTLAEVRTACSRVLQGDGVKEELYRLSVSDSIKDSMCKLHKGMDPSVDDDCNMCFKHGEW